jgi:hypothetical protein
MKKMSSSVCRHSYNKSKTGRKTSVRTNFGGKTNLVPFFSLPCMSFSFWLFVIIPSLGYFNLTLMPQKEKEKKEENVHMEGVICKGPVLGSASCSDSRKSLCQRLDHV